MKKVFIILLFLGFMLPQVAEGQGYCDRFGMSSWRPYNGSGRLVKIGMRKIKVIAVAGQPDMKESYYKLLRRVSVRITEWSYLKPSTGSRMNNNEVTSLIFIDGRLECFSTSR